MLVVSHQIRGCFGLFLGLFNDFLHVASSRRTVVFLLQTDMNHKNNKTQQKTQRHVIFNVESFTNAVANSVGGSDINNDLPFMISVK
jgi:hypothetical protein